MRDPKRLDGFYAELKRIHKVYFPDWRFFQLQSNIMGWIYSQKGIDPFYIEEDKCLKLLNEYVDEMFKEPVSETIKKEED